MVVEARVMTVTSAHHAQYRHLHGEQLVGDEAQALNLGIDPHEALHQRDVAERVGGARGEIAVMRLDLALHAVGLAHHQRGQHREHHAQHEQQDRQPPVDVERQRQQHHQRQDRGKMLAEESEPEPPQRVGAVQHHLHQPAGMGAGVEGQRQLHDVLEIIGQHRLALAVRQLVGMERDRALHAMVNRPNATQAASSGQAEFEASGPVCGLPESTSTILPNSTGSANCAPASSRLANGENPAQPRLLAEQFEDAGVKAQHGHSGQELDGRGSDQRDAF